VTGRFDAEEILRAAASGAFPGTNQVLIRKQLDVDPKGHEGWVFGFLDFDDIEGEIDGDVIDSLPFAKITGVAARFQLPGSIAYEDESNTFIPRQNIRDLSAPNFEALMRFNRR